MNAGPGHDGGDPIAILIAEIERWNSQINLVSRVRTGDRVAALVAQCRSGWSLALDSLAREAWLPAATYYDLGSGAGLPGLVWAVERARRGHPGWTVLVEPRDKRAWFLRRTARLIGLDGISVEASRWGEHRAGPDTKGALISLKALRLGDEQILAGLDRTPTPASGPPNALRDVAILRFLDPTHHTREWLEERFAAVDFAGSPRWRRAGVETLGEGDPRLLLTRYRSI